VAITRQLRRHGVIAQDTLTTDLEGESETVAAEIETVDPGAGAILRGYIDAAQHVLDTTPKVNKSGTKRMARWMATRAMKIHARAAIEYLEAGNTEMAVWNALVAAHNAWIVDVQTIAPQLVTGVKRTRTGIKAAANTNEVTLSENQVRDRKIQKKAKQLIENGQATETSVAGYMHDNGLAKGVRGHPDRTLSKKQIRRILDNR